MRKQYKVLIVDDKKLDRDGVCFLINQNALPLITETASNGCEALTLINKKKYDILFTDIRMPNMTGLELIKKAKDIDPLLKCIIFSSYDDFEYAKKGINIGIEDYLLKPVKIDDFKFCFNKIIKELSDMQKQENTLTIYDIICNSESLHNYDNIEKGYLFCIDFIKPFYNHISSTYKAPEGIIRIPLNEYQCIYIAPNKEIAEQYINNNVKNNNHINNTYLITFGGLFDSPETLKKIYSNIEKYSSTKFFISKNEIAYIDDLTENTNVLDISRVLNSINEISTFIKRNQYESAYEALHEIFLVFQLERNIPVIVIKSACFSLVNEVIYSSECNYDNYTLLLEKIDKCNNIEDLLNTVLMILHREKTEDSNILTIQTALDIIHQKYMNEDLRLESISMQVFLSPCYFSTLFKKATGTSFLKYLTQYRVEKAKDLLRTSYMRIGEICERVGYTNCSYFCNIFRNYTGMTPNQYREKKDDKKD